MVEFHRLGGTSGMIRKGERYVRTAGWDKPAGEITMDLDHYEFFKNLNMLRYTNNPKVTQADVENALSTLSAQAARMLSELPPVCDGGTIQIDLVASAAELWAFPFEACCDGSVPRFANADRRVVLTRRVRAAFAERAVAWPVEPRILFLHAAISSDLSRELVNQHVAALRKALRPWMDRHEPGESLMVVREMYALPDLIAAIAARPEGFTHIHLLAHGQRIPDPYVDGYGRWGLRLGPPGDAAADPEDIARALEPRNGLPVVVTLAACDAGNQAEPAIPTYSLAQDLHRRGVPVVIASQLPLTQPGSALMAEHFYEPLLRGEDARSALHDARVKLHRAGEAGHDWLSLVAYIRLPEGYGDHLFEVERRRLRVELGLLKAAQRRADAVIAEPERRPELGEVEQFVRDRIVSLEQSLKELDADAAELRLECQGLLASAHKRLAELLFIAAGFGSERAQEQLLSSRQALEAALRHYRDAFRSNGQAHWQGVQQLALEAALRGGFEDPDDWRAVRNVARRVLDQDEERNHEKPDGEREIWALGTLAEIQLLAPVLGQSFDADAAGKVLETLKRRAVKDAFAIESTRRQFSRYVQWWTTANGFFPGVSDLSLNADPLVRLLS